MAYGEKYKYYFYWDHDSSNNYYKVSILEDGYASTVTELTVGASPWVVSIDGQLDTIENPILGSSVNFQVIADGSEYTTYDTDFLESDYKDFIVKLIEDPDGTPVTKWVGFLMPANATRDYLGEKKVYQLSATDGLADLKNKKYSTNGEDTGSAYTGFDDMLSIIKKALGKVADITEMQLDFRIQLGTYSDQMTFDENAFKESEITQELFSEQKDGVTEFNSCYEVLQKILSAFYCSLMQDDGYYWIVCHGERNTYYYEYDWSTLTEQSRTNWTNKRIDAQSYEWLGDGTLYKTSPFKDFNIKLYNKNFDPELIVNGGFDSNITGWTNGDADDSSNGFSGISHVNVGGIGGTLRAQWGGAASTGDYHFHTTSAITLDFGVGAQNVTVTVRVEYNAETPSGLTVPNIRTRLWNSTDGYRTGSPNYTAINKLGGYYEYSWIFSASALTVAGNYLDVEIQVVDATTTSIDFYFDNISMQQASENVPSDWLYTGVRDSGSQTKNSETIQYIAERQESDNDICAIKDAGGTYVSDWNRYGLTTEDRSLMVILQQFVFNSNRRYMSYIKGTIKDENQNINAFNSLLLNDGDFRIIGMEKDYREAAITVDLVEVVYTGLFMESDTTFDQELIRLESAYGESLE